MSSADAAVKFGATSSARSATASTTAVMLMETEDTCAARVALLQLGACSWRRSRAWLARRISGRLHAVVALSVRGGDGGGG